MSGYVSRYSEGLRASRPEFDSLQGQDFSLLHVVQTGSGAQTVSYPKGTGGSSQGVKRQGVKLTARLNIVLRSRMVELCLHYPICLHGIVLN
jgi:hypothetical protein